MTDWKPSRERCKRFALPIEKIRAFGESGVYCVRSEEGGYWKIGLSSNLLQRFVGLEEGLPFRISVVFVASAPSLESLEASLLERLEPWRTRGEWHAVPSDEMPFFVSRMSSGVARAASVVTGPGFRRVRPHLEHATIDGFSRPVRIIRPMTGLRSALDLIASEMPETPLDRAQRMTAIRNKFPGGVMP